MYTVKYGYTLYRIARMTGSSVSELARLNNIPSPYTLAVGQQLKVKAGGNASIMTGKSSTKTVKATPSYKVPTSSWPPVGQRCWRWPASGKIVMPYSLAEGGNKWIDIVGTGGQPVYASGDVKVIYFGNQLRGYGNLIMIKQSDDYITAYAHNDTILVNTVQNVKAGSAYSGQQTEMLSVYFMGSERKRDLLVEAHRL